MGKPRLWNDEQLIAAHAKCDSIRQILQELGLVPAGGNYLSIKLAIERLGLKPLDGKKAQAWSRGKKLGPRRPVEYYLTYGVSIGSDALRKRLINSNLKEAVCEICQLDKWLGEPIPLELDHIDGDHINNNLANLRIICPNCHAQTPNYRGKNIGKTRA